MEEWKEYKLGDICKSNINSYSEKDNWSFVNYLDTGNITENKISDIQFIDLSSESLPSRARRKVQLNDIIYSTVRPNQKHFGIIKNKPENFLVSTGFAVLHTNKTIADPNFIFYNLIQNENTESLHAIAEQTTSAYPAIKPSDIENLSIKLPPLPTQQKIAAILSSLDDKIELNNKINTNLEQQAGALFKNWFANKIDNVSEKDGRALDTLIDIVDNRGKTPPSSNEKNDFPILDVGALNSTGRIIDYKNCTKYVDEQTYNTFFRDGHPRENDILISTVGSLAQMKFFKGDKGCIAQNVVAFRTLNTSPFYLYEYLKFIKNDLLAYDIGSVQPSIKVTHIIKHLIYIPTNNELSKFDSFAKSITEQIYNNVCENERLISIRDTLLPKLMNGEIEV